MALIGSVETLRSQLARPEHFGAAFHYLLQALDPNSEVHARILAVPPGETQRVELAGGAFALEQAYQTKPRAEGRFEAHQTYVDLQAIVEGVERMEVIAAARLVERENHLEERDVRFFDGSDEASVWRVAAGEVAVFFPVDAHMPSLAVGQTGRVYKTVVKVPVPA